MTGQWCVAIEENVNGYTFLRLTQQLYPDRATAVAAGGQAAWQFRPRRPTVPKGRSVYRGEGGSYLVSVRGAMVTGHFRVSVMEWLGDGPA